ncbi:hypothetical protein Glove_213g59 [Diversispora epigaea]|uniref:SWIM-type domain-containing protein n=1 Tax=Diversispora epigaea TaxID=1348612 RepID=A0A397IR80_9GLOM|nr:hypothetical protein Glove_213g59 [Diversispora epigaea]
MSTLMLYLVSVSHGRLFSLPFEMVYEQSSFKIIFVEEIVSIQDDERYEEEINNITLRNSEDEIMNLCVGCAFNSWENIDFIMEVYGKKHGFTIIKKRLMRHENGNIKHRSFGCEFEFLSKYRCIPDDVLKEIQFLTEHGNLSINIQRKLLKAKFPALSILDCDFANAIQKYKVKADVTHDASQLLKTLIQYKSNDPGWFVEFQLDNENRLIRLFWMSPTQIALCICEKLFYERWSSLIEKYSSAKDYLMRALYPNRQAWARAFTSKIFTAGIQATSRVESHNNIIKHELKANSTLCDLADVLDARLGNESKWNHFFEYRTLSTCMGITSVGNDLFPQIDKVMSKYLTLHILSAEYLEMTQCLYFTANKIESNLDEDSSISLADGFIEDLYDFKQILLKSMIAEVGEKNFHEIWKISDMRSENKKHIHFVIVVNPISYLCSCMSNISRGIVCRHYFQVMMISTVAGFQIQMVPSRWYVDSQKDKDVVAETCCFINQEAMQNFSGETLIPNPSTVPMTVTIILCCAAKKKVKYGEVWGLARQAAQFAVEHDSYGVMIAWLRKFTDQHKEIMSISAESVQNQNYPEIQVDDSNKENEPEIENPLVSRCKGRPETKRYKSSTEKKPRAKYTCSTCGQSGHNSARCSNR